MTAQHTWDFENQKGDHGPGCLNRHVSWFARSNPCSHRAQAHEKAKNVEGGVGPQNRYSWPVGHLGPPTPNAWNFGERGNFERRSRVPWWHESHHVIPNGELRRAIDSVGDNHPRGHDLVTRVRVGLRQEGFNLNNQVNMIILPVDQHAAEVLGLPLHRQARAHRSHADYSDHLSQRLKPIFDSMRPSKDLCEALPPYKSARTDLENLSKALYKEIMSTAARSLDALAARQSRASLKAGGRP